MPKLPPRSELLPMVNVLQCRKEVAEPAEYIGEWPRLGQSYLVDLYVAPGETEPRVYVQGLTANEPDNSFPFGNWGYVATIWLN